MILRSILLQDFGLYAGRQVLDLVPRTDASGSHPVVLVGGKNGAGKTTLLEAVRLALYGRRALGHRVGLSDYESYLRRRMHASRDGERAVSSSVGLEFDYAEAGEIHRYNVTRTWTAKGSKINEDLLLEKDGAVVTSVPRDEWQYFLHDLIPPGVSQLFFFDGEKISEIAEGEHDDGLADAMRGLLGIDVISRLRTDLGLYLARQNRADDSESATRLEQLLAKKAELDAKIAEAVEDAAELRSQRDAQSANAERVRRRFVAEGGDAANQRASLEASRDETRRQIIRREVELRELANGLLPLAYAPKLLSRVERHLAEEDARSRVNAETASALLAELRAWQTKAASATWTEGHWTDLERFAAAQSESITGGMLSDVAERDALRRRISQVRAATSSHSALLAHELAELTGQLSEAEASLVRADGHAAGVLLDEMAVSEQRVGATEAKLKAREEELRSLEYQRATLMREQERLLESQTAVSLAMERAKLAALTSQTLARYEQRLLELKVEQLRREFTVLFNHLARKGDLVADVAIDPDTFASKLIDASGREIPKVGLSAGEKQVYAIAMLWALARTSGRPLPMIIDTPLARLDSEHRATIVERYFPSASHQVIVLSTDTEVDGPLLARLDGSVSHSYRLEYDSVAGRTVAIRGYFGNEGGEDALLQA